MKTSFNIFNGVMQAKNQNDEDDKVINNILINNKYNNRKLHYLWYGWPLRMVVAR